MWDQGTLKLIFPMKAQQEFIQPHTLKILFLGEKLIQKKYDLGIQIGNRKQVTENGSIVKVNAYVHIVIW